MKDKMKEIKRNKKQNEKNIKKTNDKNNNSIRDNLVSEFYKNNHLAFALALIVSILSGTTGLIVSWILKEFIDLMSGQSRYTMKEMLLISAAFVGFTFVLTVMNYISEPGFIRKAMKQYKDKAFSLLASKNIASFRDETTSEYLSALTNDATSIETNYVSKILPIVTKSVTFSGALIMMIISSPILTGFVILIMVIPTFVSAIMSKKLEKEQKAVSEKNAEFTSTITDCLGGFQVIKSFRAEDEANKLFVEENTRLEDSKCRMKKVAVVAGSLGAIAGLLAQLGVFIMGAYLAMHNKNFTAGSVLMFTNLMNFLIQPVSELPALLAGKKAAGGLINKLSESLSKNSGSTGTEEIKSVGDSISLTDVSYSYDGEKEVLHDINCSFEPCKSYAIVGGSGSGKSTFLNLLMASNNDYKGSITIDGKELKNISTDSLYDMMTVIQQNVFIFNSTIKENVTMFRDFSQDRVDDVLTRAHLEQLINERGESYLCGENGKGLSGGEKQRISIARSLLKESPILLADEVTSALDAKTSHEVIDEILSLDSMTRIVVTHSLEESTLRKYDEIIVIKDGTIEEKGDFETLIKNDGYFKALFTVAA